MPELFRWCLLACLMQPLADAAAAPFVLDVAHTSAYFAVAHFDRSMVRGRFNKISGTVDFDAAARSGTIDIHIDPASVDTGVRVLDSVLKSPQFFDAEQFGDIRFQSAQFAFDGERLQAVAGKLTVRGVTLPATLQTQHFRCGEVKIILVRRYVCGGDFQLTIQRSTFGMTRNLPDVGDAVQINVSAEASPAD